MYKCKALANTALRMQKDILKLCQNPSAANPVNTAIQRTHTKRQTNVLHFIYLFPQIYCEKQLFFAPLYISVRNIASLSIIKTYYRKTALCSSLYIKTAPLYCFLSIYTNRIQIDYYKTNSRTCYIVDRIFLHHRSN